MAPKTILQALLNNHMKHTTSIDTYFNQLNPSQRVELERIRNIVLAVAPEALEKISYGMPTMTYKGKVLVHFAAFKNHLSLFPTPGPIEELALKLKDYKTSKGTIQFSTENPLPEKLICEIIAIRIRDINQA